MTEVRHDARAQIDAAQIRTTTRRSAGRRGVRTEVRVEIAIVGLEETEGEAMIHETADRSPYRHQRSEPVPTSRGCGTGTEWYEFGPTSLPPPARP